MVTRQGEQDEVIYLPWQECYPVCYMNSVIIVFQENPMILNPMSTVGLMSERLSLAEDLITVKTYLYDQLKRYKGSGM